MAEHKQRVLVVTEDPEFGERARETFVGDALETVVCLGPAHTECLLDTEGSCPLVARAGAVIVDPPRSGMFRRYEKSVWAVDYAERLAATHPHLFVLLAGFHDGPTAFSGDIAVASCATGAVDVVHDMFRPRNVDDELFTHRNDELKRDELEKVQPA